MGQTFLSQLLDFKWRISSDAPRATGQVQGRVGALTALFQAKHLAIDLILHLVAKASARNCSSDCASPYGRRLCRAPITITGSD